MLSPSDVAERLRISHWTVVRLIKRGELPASKIGGQFRVSEEDLNAYIRSRRVVAGGAQ